jgi:hypothetical protein
MEDLSLEEIEKAWRRVSNEPVKGEKEKDEHRTKMKRLRAKLNSSRYDYGSAGGHFIPTEKQSKEAREHLKDEGLSREDSLACKSVILGYELQREVSHDDIHVVNSLTRAKAADKHVKTGRLTKKKIVDKNGKITSVWVQQLKVN